MNHGKILDNTRKAKEHISQNVVIKTARIRRLVQITDAVLIMTHRRILDYI